MKSSNPRANFFPKASSKDAADENVLDRWLAQHVPQTTSCEADFHAGSVSYLPWVDTPVREVDETGDPTEAPFTSVSEASNGVFNLTNFYEAVLAPDSEFEVVEEPRQDSSGVARDVLVASAPTVAPEPAFPKPSTTTPSEPPLNLTVAAPSVEVWGLTDSVSDAWSAAEGTPGVWDRPGDSSDEGTRTSTEATDVSATPAARGFDFHSFYSDVHPHEASDGSPAEVASAGQSVISPQDGSDGSPAELAANEPDPLSASRIASQFTPYIPAPVDSPTAPPTLLWRSAHSSHLVLGSLLMLFAVLALWSWIVAIETSTAGNIGIAGSLTTLALISGWAMVTWPVSRIEITNGVMDYRRGEDHHRFDLRDQRLDVRVGGDPTTPQWNAVIRHHQIEPVLVTTQMVDAVEFMRVIEFYRARPASRQHA